MPKTEKFWKVKNLQTKNAAELILYGEISDYSWWGDEVTPKALTDDLATLGDITDLTVRINSGGGDVFAGVAIHSILKRHKANVTVYVDGIAASIASVIAMAGDKIIMPKGSMMMIHNPWTFAYGDSRDLRKTADTLDSIRDSILAIYEGKTGLSNEDLIAMLDEETWMNATEAVEKSFATEVEESEVAASIRDKTAIINGVEMDWSKFTNAPKLPKEKIVANGRNLDLEYKSLALYQN